LARRRLSRAILGGAILLLVLASALGYLLNADLGWSRGLATRAVSRALGRNVTVGGEYHLRLGRILRLEAGGIVIANAPWAANGPLGSIGHLELRVDTRSLLRGPIHILALTLDDVELHLESNASGRGNWEAAPSTAAGEGEEAPPVPHVDRVEIRGFHLGYDAPARPKPLELTLPEARFQMDPGGIVQLNLHGSVDGKRVLLAGHLGPVASIVGGKPFRQDLSFRLGTLEGRFEGKTVSLSTLAGASLDLSLQGAELAELTTLFGLPGGKRGPFRLRARTRPTGSSVDASIEMTTSLLRAEGEGRILPGAPPSIDLRLMVSGKNLGKVTALAGIDGLPNTPFELRTKLRSHGFPLRFEALTLTAGPSTIAAGGTLGKPPGYEGTDISAELRTPDTTLIGRLAGLPLPRGPLEARARLAVSPQIITVSGLEARLGANVLRADGTLGRDQGHPGSSFRIDLHGPDLAAYDALAGIHLPPGPFQAAGTIASAGRGFELESVTIELGEDHIEASGKLSPARDRTGSELELSLRGRDPTFLASLAGIRGLPATAYRGSGHLHIGARSLEIRKVELVVGDHELRGEIRLARPPATDPIELHLQVQGKNLSELGPLLGLHGLPNEAYHASGGLEITPSDYGFSGIELRCGDLSLDGEGRLGRPPAFDGTALRIRAAGSDLSVLGPTLTLPDLPGLPFQVAGKLLVDADAITLQKITGTLGTSAIAVDGAFRPRGLPVHVALDLRVEGNEPSDLTRFLQGLGLGTMPALPSRPYTVAGRFAREPGGYHFGGLHFALGALRGGIDGLLGAAPAFHGTVLDVEASGATGADILELTGKHLRVKGLRFHCRVRRLERKGASSGPLLSIGGDLAADRLELGRPKASPASPPATPAAAPSSPEERGQEETEALVFSKEPFRLKLPKKLTGKIDCNIATLVLPTSRLDRVHAGIGLDADGLHLESLHAKVEGGGSIGGSLSLRTVGTFVRVNLDLHMAGVRTTAFFPAPPREDEPRVEAHLQLAGEGASPHELVSHANGRFSLVFSQGKIQSSLLDTMGDSFLLHLLDALNPFRKKEKLTALDCAMFAGIIRDGIVALDPLGIKTKNVTTVARGTVDLATEGLDIDFASKARRGLGLSASTLTNAYIKIGGTLAKPSVQFKPVSAAAKTGLAVVTAGISLLAEGLWNRISSGADTCGDMAEAIDRMWNEPHSPEDRPGER